MDFLVRGNDSVPVQVLKEAIGHKVTVETCARGKGHRHAPAPLGGLVAPRQGRGGETATNVDTNSAVCRLQGTLVDVQDSGNVLLERVFYWDIGGKKHFALTMALNGNDIRLIALPPLQSPYLDPLRTKDFIVRALRNYKKERMRQDGEPRGGAKNARKKAATPAKKM